MMNPFDLDDKVTAAAVTAVGTVIGALVQLRMSWRKEVSERARGVPVTKKSRRGPVLAVFLLVVAAGVGGFALSQYLAIQSEHESAALRGELRTQIAQISATAARLEHATLSDRGPAMRTEDVRHGDDDATATATIGPCRVRAADADAAPVCSEQEAARVTLCTSVPSSAVTTAVLLYARPEGSPQPWTGSGVVPGQDIGRARFADKPFERTDSDQTRQVCTEFSSWDGDHAFSARLVVKYAPAPAPHELSQAAVAPISDAVAGH